MTEGKPVELLRDRRGIYGIGVRTRCAMTSNTEHKFAHTNRHLVEVPDTFAVARCSSSPSSLQLPPPPARVTAALYQSVRPCGGYREQVRGYCRNARHERPRRREGLVQLQVKRRT